MPKNAVFKNLPVAQKIGTNLGLYSGLRELRESIWSILKKGRQNFQFVFENQLPPREIPRYAPEQISYLLTLKLNFSSEHLRLKVSFN